jgi:hypothetical protein
MTAVSGWSQLSSGGSNIIATSRTNTLGLLGLILFLSMRGLPGLGIDINEGE